MLVLYMQCAGYMRKIASDRYAIRLGDQNTPLYRRKATHRRVFIGFNNSKWLQIAIAAIPIDKAPGRHFRSNPAPYQKRLQLQESTQQALLAALFEDKLSLKYILYCCLSKGTLQWASHPRSIAVATSRTMFSHSQNPLQNLLARYYPSNHP